MLMLLMNVSCIIAPLLEQWYDLNYLPLLVEEPRYDQGMTWG